MINEPEKTAVETILLCLTLGLAAACYWILAAITSAINHMMLALQRLLSRLNK